MLFLTWRMIWTVFKSTASKKFQFAFGSAPSRFVGSLLSAFRCIPAEHRDSVETSQPASQPAHGDRLCIYASLLEEHEFHMEAVHGGVADQDTASVTLNYGTEKKWSSKKVCLHGCYIISMSGIGPGG